MMQGHIEPGCTGRLLAAVPLLACTTELQAVQEQSKVFIYLKIAININISISLALGRKVCLPAHGHLGQPSHYPIPEVGAQSKLQLPTPVLENQPIEVFSFSWEVSSCLD